MVTWRLSREAIAHLLGSIYIILGSPTFVTRGVRLAGYRFPKASEIWRTAMSQYSCIEIIKTKAKQMVRLRTLKRWNLLHKIRNFRITMNLLRLQKRHRWNLVC